MIDWNMTKPAISAKVKKIMPAKIEAAWFFIVLD